MKQSYFTGVMELFPGSDVVRKYSFKAMRLGDNYAHLAVICPIRAALFALLRVESALLAVANRQLAHGFVISREKSALFANKIVLNACHHI
ncbi:MAG: hypothetical protein FWC32_04925 [Firmicutes bacterium]|nr:hypothetical protein [Bacillota bacterium]